MTTYRATRVIYINGTRAFNEGDKVPEGHVARFELGDAVTADPPPAAVEAPARARKTNSDGR